MSESVSLTLHEFHHAQSATFQSVNGQEVVAHYGDATAEYAALKQSVGLLDFSFRSRVCLIGADRIRFLHGQVTNDVKRLRGGEGCYAALTTAKGKMQSDLNIFNLQEELLLDFESGLTALVSERLNKYIVADDVQVVDVAPHYGLLSVQGPKAAVVLQSIGRFDRLPDKPLTIVSIADATTGDWYVANHARVGSVGYDIFVPDAALETAVNKLLTAVKSVGGSACGWDAFEIARLEAGIPRFGVDMDESHLASECGIENRAISYSKGCYIGQEVLNRIHSMGHVNRELRALHISTDVQNLPKRGDKLFHDGKEVGHLTSVAFSPELKCGVALGYVRRESNAVGNVLQVRADAREFAAKIVTPIAGAN